MNQIKTIIKILRMIIQQIRMTIVMLIAIVGIVVSAVVYFMLDGMQNSEPKVSINRQILHERLFISVRQDSLSQLVQARGLDYSGPDLFRRRASIGIPADRNLQSELDSLQHYYPDDIELDDGQLLCRTQKVEGVRYVSVPVVWLIRLRLMSVPAGNVIGDEQ